MTTAQVLDRAADGADANPPVVRALSGGGRLTLTWADGHTTGFHYIWLRDVCTCAACGGDPVNNRKLVRVVDVPPDVHPASHRIDENGALRVTWAPLHHESVYDAAWLRRHGYSDNERAGRRHRPTLWNAKLGDRLPQADFRTIFDSDAALYGLLRGVRDYGVAIVRGADVHGDTLERTAALFGYVREFGYGRFFDIVWKDVQRTIAHTKETILPHSDEPFRYHPPGISLFHCLQASGDGGGESILVDGFAVVEALRRSDPGAVELLSRVPQTWRIRPLETQDYRAQGRLICLDVDGQVAGIRFNERSHVPLDLPDHLVKPFYAAFRALQATYDDQAWWFRLMLRPGDLLIYDNERVLHGRTAFQGERHLRLCAVERDEYHSRLRVLGRRLGSPDAELVLPAGVAF